MKGEDERRSFAKKKKVNNFHPLVRIKKESEVADVNVKRSPRVVSDGKKGEKKTGTRSPGQIKQVRTCPSKNSRKKSR